jgi:hypothetical protein
MTTTPSFTRFDRIFLEKSAEIERSGFAHINVAEPNGVYSYSYTLGFHRLGHPELIIAGMCQHHLSEAARFVFDAATGGSSLPIGRDHPILFDGGSFVLDPIPDVWLTTAPNLVLMWWDHFGRTEVPALVQLVMADDAGRMPWENRSGPDPFVDKIFAEMVWTMRPRRGGLAVPKRRRRR